MSIEIIRLIKGTLHQATSLGFDERDFLKRFYDSKKEKMQQELLSKYESFMAGEISTSQFTKVLNKLEISLGSNINSWDDLSIGVGLRELFSLFIKCHEKLSDADYWLALREAYTGCDNLPDSNVCREFFSSSRGGKENLRTTSETKKLSRLPQIVTIYRGCSQDENENSHGISWTLNQEIALWYANDYSRNLKTTTHVLEKTIKSNDIVAYFASRNEEEVIYLGGK